MFFVFKGFRGRLLVSQLLLLMSALCSVAVATLTITELTQDEGAEQLAELLQIMRETGAGNFVLDEPTTGLDARGIALVGGIIGDLVAEGRSVVGISHDMRFVAETFARVVVLRDGRITLDGTPREVFGPDQWETLRAGGLEPPAAARIGSRLGLGSTPTDDAIVAALAARG